MYWLKGRFRERLYADHPDIWESLVKSRRWEWTCPWTWSHNDPAWLAGAPELRELFYRIRDGAREWNFRAMPIMVVVWLVFGFLVTYLQRHQ